MEAPDALRAALSALAEEYPTRALAHEAASLSQAYRGESGAAPLDAIHSPIAAAAYAVTRLPATYAALAATLAATQQRLPAWQPTTLLDAGAGPGVSVWAASAIWPSLTHATLLERDQRMMAVGQRLMREAPPDCAVNWRQTDLTDTRAALAATPVDLCISSYALNELPHAERLPFVARLWEACGGALALVAPGTPAGFAAIREARAWLIDAGAQIVAPCPHADVCPMTPGDWCHFSQRLARSRLHRQLKGGDAPFEDEKYSYVVAARMPSDPIAARVIRHPNVYAGHITLDLCAPGGLKRAEVTRSDRAAWRTARDARWGSALASLPTKLHDL